MDSEEAFQAAVKRGMFAGLSVPRANVLTLPWPNKVLSPNARVHWARRADAARRARVTAAWSTRAAIGTIKAEWVGARLAFTFCPPDKRRRDTDNCIASTKAHRDGIADALGIDDSKFVCSYAMGEPTKGGAVRVEIKPIS